MEEEEPTLSGKPRVPSEKHDLLYSKARYVQNQRHIKRPWFNLNPFLEKTDETIDLDNYLPEESRYIQPLESLVLCESYHRDNATDTREIPFDQFFDYLNSDEWEQGCSIRVLEGQLLTQILLGLYRLEKDGKAVRHTTYAFAKNNRPRNGCYKLTDKETYGTIKETLLLEFAYFGRLTKKTPNPRTQKPLEYLRLGVPDHPETNEIPSEQVTPQLTLLDILGKKRSRGMSVSTDATSMSPFGIGAASQDGEDSRRLTGNWGRRGSVMNKTVGAIRALKALQPGVRRQSLAMPQSYLPSPPSTSLKPLLEKRRESAPDSKCRRRKDSTASSIKGKKYAAMKLFPDLDEDFTKQETENEEENETNTEEKTEEFFGEELLLSENKPQTMPKLPDDVETKLKKNKTQIRQRRKDKAEAKQEKKRFLENTGIPKLPPLDVEKINKNNIIMHHTVKMPDEVPTFEEFVKLLKEDEYYDPRYRNKVRMKSRKIAQRYYIAKNKRRTSTLLSTDDLSSLIGSAMSMRQGKRSSTTQNQRSSEDGSRLNVRLPTVKENKHIMQSSISETSDSDEDRPPARDAREITEFSNEILGLTDSLPCREHYLINTGGSQIQQEPINRRASRADLGRTPRSMSKTDGHAHNEEDRKRSITRRRSALTEGGRLSPLPQSSKTSRLSPTKSPVPPMFPKIVSNDDGNESAETTEDESETDDDVNEESFDVKRLNIRYSIERLRKKRKSRAGKKKPAFYDILAKYYKMQTAITTFNKGVLGKVRRQAQGRGRRMGIFQVNQPNMQEEDPMTIGKLKKFNFMDVASNKKRLNVDRLQNVVFSVPCLATFHENLRASIDNFVVRREIVISDVQTFYKSATSITFTKKSCFQPKDRTPHDH